MPTLGIDFGTTKTLVSWLNPQTGKPELIRLGRGSDYLPTSVFVEEDGSMVFGNDADDELARDAIRYSRGFKMKLGALVAAGAPALLT